MSQIFDNYIQSISSKFSHKETSEMGYRADFEILLKGVFESINVKRIDHDARAKQGNKPDFVVLKHDIAILYIEAKEYRINNEVRSYIESVRNAGFKTCVCSNNNPIRVRSLEERFHFLNMFDVVVFSYEVGHCKPDKEIFQALIDRSRVKPDEIVYSDDNPERVQCAVDLGIQALVYENFGQFKSRLAEFGVKIS